LHSMFPADPENLYKEQEEKLLAALGCDDLIRKDDRPGSPRENNASNRSSSPFSSPAHHK